MAHAVRLTDLDAVTAHERADILRRLSAEAGGKPNGQATAATLRVRAFETRYEMPSSELVESLKAGRMRETAEIAEWLFYLRLVSLGERK